MVKELDFGTRQIWVQGQFRHFIAMQLLLALICNNSTFKTLWEDKM